MKSVLLIATLLALAPVSGLAAQGAVDLDRSWPAPPAALSVGWADTLDVATQTDDVLFQSTWNDPRVIRMAALSFNRFTSISADSTALYIEVLTSSPRVQDNVDGWQTQAGPGVPGRFIRKESSTVDWAAVNTTGNAIYVDTTNLDSNSVVNIDNDGGIMLWRWQTQSTTWPNSASAGEDAWFNGEVIPVYGVRLRYDAEDTSPSGTFSVALDVMFTQ